MASQTAIPIPLLRCFRCGNVWKPRKSQVLTCPLCKSRLWNTPRKPDVAPFDPENASWKNVVLPNREMIVAVAQKYKAKNVRVFGSVRRGSARRTSDLDLLVTFEKRATLFDQIGLKQELEERLSRRVDVLSDQAVFWYLRPQILAEAIPL